MNNELLCVFEEYLSITKMLGSNTTSSYIGDLSSLQEFIGDKSLTLLSSEDIIDFLSQFSNKRTLNRKLSSINTFFRFCHEYNFEHSKVSIPMSKIPKNLPKYLSSQEIINNIKMIDKSTYFGLRDYALILFLYASGCRVSEALNIQKGDIIDGWLKIRFAKGEKERIVPLAPIAIKALDEYLEHQDMRNSYLWLNYKGEKLSRISAFKIVKKYLGVSPHVLRHSFASALIIGGADLRVVQELLGHSSLVTTQIYTHIQKQNLSDTMQSFHPLRSF
jgi:integrase/recombinase XerD